MHMSRCSAPERTYPTNLKGTTLRFTIRSVSQVTSKPAYHCCPCVNANRTLQPVTGHMDSSKPHKSHLAIASSTRFCVSHHTWSPSPPTGSPKLDILGHFTKPPSYPDLNYSRHFGEGKGAGRWIPVSFARRLDGERRDVRFCATVLQSVPRWVFAGG
jgi:hypothetical protein